MKNLKLFVWEKVLCDWSCGIVVVLAKDLEHAKELLKEEDYVIYRELFEEDGDDYMKQPKIVTEPSVFYVWGGG